MDTTRELGMRMLGAFAALCLALCALFACARPAQAAGLDSANLLQGEYTVEASMMKGDDPAEVSIANGALVNPLRISVDASHRYTATVGMKGITMMGATAYMKSLSYLDGSQYKDATIVSTYDVTDSFGSGYPKELSFPLANKAAGDENGYVKLRVDVPIIAAMSGGRASSVQDVNLKIDWATLAPTKILETVSNGVNYTIVGKTATATSISKSAKSVTVKSTVKIGGKSYKVTSIKAKAAYRAKSLKSVTLGKNLKSIGENAFKGIAKKATFKCPKSKMKTYKKLVKNAGAPKTVKFKAA